MSASSPDERAAAGGRRLRAGGLRVVLALGALGLLLLLVAGLGLALTSPPAPAQAQPAADPHPGMLDATIAHLQRAQNGDGGFPMRSGEASDAAIASSWAAIALAAAGVNPREQFRPGDGEEDVHAYIARHAAELTYTTDFERVLLVVNAAGTDPHAFGGVDLVARILERRRPDGAFDRDPAKPAASVNGTIFAILSLSLVEEPAVDAAIASAADWVLGAQNDDGSWPAVALGGVGNTDLTGAALQALRAAGRLDDRGGAAEERARAARDHALGWFREMQRADGGFADPVGSTESNSASTAWVAQGLWAVGQDPGQWRKDAGGPSMLDFLASLQQDDGSIRWKASADMNPVWMTAYTAPAYSGRYLPIPAVPYTGRVPAPRDAPREQQPADGTGGGSGGAPGSGAQGGGVLAGGGGEGAPNFSRPKQGSKGRTVGGARRLRATRAMPAGARARARARRRSQQQEEAQREREEEAAAAAGGGEGVGEEADPATAPVAAAPGTVATPSAPPVAGGGDAPDADAARGGRRDNAGSRGLAAGASQPAPDAAGSGEEVSGVVVGGETGAAGTEQDALPAAYGLHGAQAGGDTGPWVATGLGGALLLCASAGGLLERRRPGQGLIA